MHKTTSFSKAAALFVALMLCIMAPMSAYAVQVEAAPAAEQVDVDAPVSIAGGALLLINQPAEGGSPINTLASTLISCGMGADMLTSILDALPSTTVQFALLEPVPAAADESGIAALPTYACAWEGEIPAEAVDGVITFDTANSSVLMYAPDAFALTAVQVEDVKNAAVTLELVLAEDAVCEEVYSLIVPTEAPTAEPTPEPTEEPTPEPTEEPTPEPTEVPTPEPTEEPTPEPTEEPTPEPTEEPTPEPTEVPTPEPTEVPTPEPTEVPTPEPTEVPTPEPTEVPTPEPTEVPTVLVAAIGDSGLSIVAAPSVAEGLMTAAEISEQLLAMGYAQEDIDAALTALMPAEASTFDWTLYTLAQTDAEGVTVIEQNAYDALLASGIEPEFAVGAVPTAEPVATEAPVTEAPATDAPATDAPVTDAPATDAPVTDAPATDVPATDVPATEAPVTEAPATDAPATEAPVTEAPATDAPATEAPATDAPATDVPAIEALPAIADGATLGVLLLPEDIEGAQPIGTLSAYLLANGYTADETIDLVEQSTAAHAVCFVPFSPAADGSTIVDEAVLPALELAGIKGLVAGDVVTLASLNAKLTAAPTTAATEEPTAIPTEAPTEEPTAAPTEASTEEPTAAPTEAPTEEPTLIPTEEPTEAPTEAPTEQPTEAPTEAPAASGLGAGGYFGIAAVLIAIGVALFLWSRKRKN